MKQTTKNFLGLGVIIALSSGIAGLTTYAMMKPNKGNLTFEEMFPQKSKVQLANYNSVDAAQPVDLTQAAANSLHAVVHIKSTVLSKTQTVQQAPDIFDFFFGPGNGGGQRQMQTEPQVGFGSGVIISNDGYIVTNNHVIEGSDEIDVTLNDKRGFKARLIGTDPNTDLALLKIEGKDFPTLPVGDSESLKVGEWVLA
ncbi:MAG: trypsin-like peptidase domain-containing protein, partial [Bacteroidaceae bacterium]